MTRLAVIFAAILSLGCVVSEAQAQHASAFSFGETAGLEDDAIRRIVLAPNGTLLTGTERGLYDFDGSVFTHLGGKEALPPLLLAKNIAVADDGRIAVADDRHIFLADGRDSTPPRRLSFEEITLPTAIGHNTIRQLAWWNGSLIGVIGSKLVTLLPSGIRPPRSAASLAVFKLGTGSGILAASTLDGRICRITSATVQCAHPAENISGHADNWSALAIAADGTIYAHSAQHFATLHPGADTYAVENIRDDGYEGEPLLAVQADGTPLIWAGTHLLTRSHDGWRQIALPTTIQGRGATALALGTHGELWLGIPGAGLVELPNYRNILNYETTEGFTFGSIWQFSRASGNDLLVGASRAIVSIPAQSHPGEGAPHLELNEADLFASFPDDTIWARSAVTHLLHTRPANRRSPQSFQLPYIHKLAPDGKGGLDILTDDGLYVVADATAADAKPVRVPGTSGPFVASARDDQGRLWLSRPNGMDVLLPDGHMQHPLDHWPISALHPADMIAINPQTFWVGGAAGIVAVRHDGTTVQSSTALDIPELQSRYIYCFVRDSKGHIWSGTEHGLFVQDKDRWININARDGLVGNDIDQNATLLDADGSLWIGTTFGFSHILHPSDLLAKPDLQTRVVSADIESGTQDTQNTPYMFDYSRAPLEIRMEASPITRAAGLVFHYKLGGVDQDWLETKSNTIRYPVLPTGHHVFEVYAAEPHTGERSPVVSLTLCMHKPWWLLWPIEALYGVAGLLLLGCMILLQTRLRRRQQRILLHTVDQKTRELTAAKLALELEARTDGVTGLMNRRTIQTLLSDQLDFTHRKNARTRRKNDLGPDIALSCMIALLDLDHFKRINDQHGHLVGDQVLREIGDRFRGLLAPGEYCGRYGGEEFLLVLTNDPSGIVRISTIAGALTRQSFNITPTPFRVTLSVGVAEARREDNWETLIDRADKALYDAKAGGRDQIVVAP